MTNSLDQFPQRDGLYRIMPEGIAVHNRYQDKVLLLDSWSSEMWLRADGKTSLRVIARDIAGMSGEREDMLLLTLPMLMTILATEGVMFQLDQPTPLPYHLALPQEDQDIGLMRESMEAAGWLDE